jgi:hypothetical protein
MGHSKKGRTKIAAKVERKTVHPGSRKAKKLNHSTVRSDKLARSVLCYSSLMAYLSLSLSSSPSFCSLCERKKERGSLFSLCLSLSPSLSLSLFLCLLCGSSM